MNEFINKLILKEEEYKNGWFAKVPPHNKRNSAFILTGGIKDDIEVVDTTTAQEIRLGKYTRLVEISTAAYVKEIKFNTLSRESAFSFDIYIKAVIQVKDPIAFYHYKNLDVDEYFKNMFFMDVNKITKAYSILQYNGLDEELIRKLSNYDNVEADTGFGYRISAVWAKPGEQATTYVTEQSKQIVEAELKNRAKEFVSVYKQDYEDAIWTQVAEGKLSQLEAHEKIQEWNMKSYENQMKITKELLENNIITNREARESGRAVIHSLAYKTNMKQITEQDTQKDVDLDKFFNGD